MPASPSATRRSWVWLTSIGSPSSSRSVVVAADTDVAVLDGIGIGVGLRQEGLVEAGLEDRIDRPLAFCANDDPTAPCGLAALRPPDLLHTQHSVPGSD